MNHYVNIMHAFEEKGKDDIPTDEELLLFSESDEDEIKPKKIKPKPNRGIPGKASCLPSSVLQSRRPTVYNN